MVQNNLPDYLKTRRRKEFANATLANKEAVVFKKWIQPNETEVLQSRVKADATIEEMQVRFYSGQVGTLHVTPFVEHKGNLINPLYSIPATGEPFLSGDDDNFTFPISEPVFYDDYLKVRVTNTGDYPYLVFVVFILDYLGGDCRIVGGC
jgi:hypothetical protein